VEKSLQPKVRRRLAEREQRDKKLPPLSRFLPKAPLRWLRTYSEYALVRRPKFPAPDEKSLVPISNDTKIAVAGDWATGTDESAHIADLMGHKKPHYTIHLGDVYYVGDPPSIAENCRNIRQPDGYDGVLWPSGSLGSFALNGNHEAYARDTAYFEWIQQQLKQPSSCFALVNDHWCIVALDTGYNSEGIPWLSWLSEQFNWPILKPSCKLPPELVSWLQSSVAPFLSSNRGIVLLSHHQYYSGFDSEYTQPAKQLAQLPAFRGRSLLWLWGHEHRLAGYDLYDNGGITAYGRCLGHGGMPVDRAKSPRSDRPILFYDDRSYDPTTHKIVSTDTEYGVNGYAVLEFSGATLKISYRDIADNLVMSEQWSVADGNIRPTSQPVPGPTVRLMPGGKIVL
jgi:hypothetical protein